ARRGHRAPRHADLPRQVRHGRHHRPQGFLRRDHRRLQPDARRAPRRRAGRRAREPDGRLSFSGLQGRRRADAFPRRDPFQAGRPARPRRREEGMRIILAVALIALAFAPLGLKNYGIYLLTLWCVYVMAGMGLNLTVGYAGQMSIGHAAFLGIGAYTAAILMKLGLSFWLVLPVAALLCFAVGLVLGFPALRVQHHYLAFATLGFNVLMFLVFRNEEWLTGGTFGISGIARPRLFAWSLDGSGVYFFFTYASTLLLALVLGWLIRSPWGRAFAALRDN